MRTYLATTIAALGILGALGGGTTAVAQTSQSDGVEMAAPAAPRGAHRKVRRRAAVAATTTATDGVTPDGEAPPTSAYRGGASVPLSQRATNNSTQAGRTEIAPRLPDPQAGSNSPEALLRAAQRSLSQNKTGAAQQALEMAETRVLSRTTEPSMAGAPDTAAMTQRIGEARRALGAGDRTAAQAAITAALAAPMPPIGPAVTTTTYPAPGPAPIGGQVVEPRRY